MEMANGNGGSDSNHYHDNHCRGNDGNNRASLPLINLLSELTLAFNFFKSFQLKNLSIGILVFLIL